jgi:hypothetical protein
MTKENHRYRTIYIDPDCRRSPKTDRFCAVCQRDLKAEGMVAWLNECCHHVVHPMDVQGHEVVGLIGPECAAKLGDAFALPGQLAPLFRAFRRWNKTADGYNSWSALNYDEKVELVKAEPCNAGDIRVFTKSGNLVQLIRRDNADWLVARIQGPSKGKQMLCPEPALLCCPPGQEGGALQEFEQRLKAI